MAESIFNSLIVYSGTEKVSEALRTNSMMAKQAAIYPITNGSTFLRLSSCQNWKSLLGLVAMNGLGFNLNLSQNLMRVKSAPTIYDRLYAFLA